MIKQSVLNSFRRVGINPDLCNNKHKDVTVNNRFGGGSCKTTDLIACCINWVYQTSNAYEQGDYSVKISDFDRIRYFVLSEDRNAYMTCLD